MSKRKKVIQIPFKDKATEWRDNCAFKAELRLTGHYRGRSSARVRVTNCDNDETYSLGLSAFFNAVKHFGAMDGTLVGTWTFRKQGSNYGIWPVVPDEVKEGDEE